MLRVGGEGLARRDAEEVGVELGRGVQESAVPGVGGAGVVGVRVVEGFEVPAPVGGELGDGVAAVAHQLPEVLGRGDAAGQAAGHADDRDRFALRPLHLLQAAVGLARVGQGALQIVAELLVVGHRCLSQVRWYGWWRSRGFGPGGRREGRPPGGERQRGQADGEASRSIRAKSSSSVAFSRSSSSRPP